MEKAIKTCKELLLCVARSIDFGGDAKLMLS